MRPIHHWRHLIPLLAAAVILSNCTPPAAEPSTSTPAQPAPATERPTATSASTLPPPTVGPTDTPIVTRGWSSTSSTATELSFRHPGEWYGPAQLPFGEGVYVKDPDKDIGVIMQLELSGDPAQLLADWGTSEISFVGLLTFTPESVADGEPITISRLEASTKIAQGNGLTAQAAFVDRPQDVMLLMWYAPTEQWNDLQATFADVLASIETWRRYTSQGLHMMYLHDWPKPVAPWEGDGIWFRSTDEKTGLVVRLGAVADPVQLLANWTSDRIAGLGVSGCPAPTPGDRMRGLSADWESQTGQCKDAAGAEVTYEVAYLADRDRVLEVVGYSPTDQWEYANEIISTMLGLLTDVR